MITRIPGVLVIAAVSACVPPPEPEVTDLAINVEASQITGPFTLAGGAFPLDQSEIGEIALHGAHAEDLLVLGQTVDQDYDMFVVNGPYDVRYRFGAGGAVVPTNETAEVISDRAIVGDAAIPVDVGAVAISATFTLNGGAFPASYYDNAIFYLEPVGSDALIRLGVTHLPNDPVMVVPGTYHVIYDHHQGTISPINRRARVQENVVLTANQQLRVDVVASSLRLSFTLNGAPFPNSEYDDANFYLRDSLTGAESLLKNSHEETPSVIAIDGTYDVIYRHETGSQVPINTAAVVVNDFALSSGGALAHDIIAVTIDASVTLNNGPFPVSEYDDANILLYDPQTNTDTELGNTHSPFSDLVLIPGTYDVLYSHETGDDVPQNVRGIVAADVAIANANLEINVAGIEVGADITLDGEAFPVSEYDDATFVLSGAQSDDAIVLGNSHDQDPSVMVLPGSYDLYYRHETGDEVPRNRNHRLLADQVLVSDTTLSTNIETRLVRLSATLNDAPFPAGPAGVLNTARIFARTGQDDDVLMVRTHGIPFTAMLITGDYELYYEHVTGSGVPRNPWAQVGQASID